MFANINERPILVLPLTVYMSPSYVAKRKVKNKIGISIYARYE